ncbi:ankyrin repeat domain-containing protein 26-like isoform X2 [Marmota monax]|uniref:ankyrin repeat domain-containing protein 26-like isoform X2 n=1 Tax=Marmota monax TaxID=9995 RepID=UPI001EB0A640|nr:ankyrin repeat domain-containing protein 26-like isoform X2 [Marmota monax]
MKAQSRTSVNFNPVKESPKDDSLRRSIKKSHSGDSLFAMVGDSYEAPIKILPQNSIGHSFGDAHQREKDGINGHTEDTVPMSSQMNESRNFEWVRPEDILKEDTPLSSMVLQNFTHPVVKPILDRRYFLQKNTVGTTEERLCKSAEPFWFSSSEEEEEGLDDTKNKQPQVFSEGGPQMCISHSSGEKHYIAKEKADGHVHASRDSSDFRKRTDPITIKEALPRKGSGKVKEKTVKLAETHFDMTSEEEHKSFDDAQCTQSQVFSEDHPQMCVSHSSGEKHHKAKEKEDGHVHDSVSLSKTQKAVLSLQRIIKSKKSHCTQCSLHVKKNAQLENEIHELKKRVSEFKQENIELKQQLHNLRYTLKEDEVKRKNDDMLHEKNKNSLKEKETEFKKEDQARKQAEISVCTVDTELETARNHFNQVSPSDGTENKLLHKYHKKKDEVSMKRLGMDTVKYQNQEKKCFENTEILREKNTSLPWTQKLNEETLMEIFQDNEQLGIWKVENTLQNFTPESEKQSTERPETDVKSHPARSGPAPPHQGESPTPKRNLELAFQRGRDKDFSSQEKKNIDVSNLNGSSEIPSQQVPKSEVKTSDLENELHQTRVMTLATDQVNRQLKQRQCQLKEMEHRYQNEERKRNEHLRKQEASKEKVSKLQRETTLHEDQLHYYQNKGENKMDGIINVQTQFYDVIKKLQARNDRYGLMLGNKYLELINETNHLKEQLDQYGKEKAEEMDDLTTKMKNASSKHLHLRTNYDCFMQNLFFIKSIQDTFEKIERNQKKLEENVVNFPRHTRSTRIERGQGVWWECDIEHRARWDLEEKQKQTQEASPEITEPFRKTNFTSIKIQMELRISHLESELKILRNATERI